MIAEAVDTMLTLGWALLAWIAVRNQWTRPPAWPKPIGKRGKFLVFDPAAVDKAIGEHIDRPALELEPRRLYTAREIEQLTGITAATIRADRSKGCWPGPDDDSGRAHRWYGATVTNALNQWRAYRKTSD